MKQQEYNKRVERANIIAKRAYREFETGNVEEARRVATEARLGRLFTSLVKEITRKFGWMINQEATL